MEKNRQQRLRMGALSVFVLTAFLTPLNATHSWGGYHWARPANPFNLLVGDNVSATWDPILDTTVSDWSISTVLDLQKTAGRANPRNCRPTAGRVEVCNSTYGNNGWLGIAQIWASGVHITQGTVRLNDTYFNTATYNSTAWRNLVSCQEVGHTLGLDHQDENFTNVNLDTCMDYTNNPGSNQHPNQHDYDELLIIYNHLDSTSTVGTQAVTNTQDTYPPAMNDLDLSGPGQWGKLVASSKNGQTEVYEADFGNGHKVVTFVIWAEGAARGR